MNGSTVTAEVFLLPPRQARVLELVDNYVATFKRPCPGAVVADALGVHRTTVSDHLAALYRKGWLRSDRAPAVPRRPYRPE